MFQNSQRKKRISAKVNFKTSELDEQIVKEIASNLEIPYIVSKLLTLRGVGSATEAKNFLTPSFRESLPDPSQIKNIVEAAKKILVHVKKRSKITIFSDFDVDGISSGAQLKLFLEALGGDVHHYTPNRFKEGYGLSKSAIQELAETGTTLLITVDCGISNHSEITLAKQLGLETIIIDHHEPHNLPEADIIVDPAQTGCPFQHEKLAAAGLVWMLLIVLRRVNNELPQDEQCATSPDPKDYLDLASLGTICDMVPLTKVNRLIAYRGIEALKNTERPGILALKNVSGVGSNAKFSTSNVSFGLGPRINAAGRIGDAKDAFELLTTNDSRRAKTLAEKIDKLNSHRRAIEEELKQICLEKIATSSHYELKGGIALFDERFHLGVIGIVAQRVVEEFYKPAAIMGSAEGVVNGRKIPLIKGSVRSISGFHVAESLAQLGDLLIGHGGHREAGGFSLVPDKLERFVEAFETLATEMLPAEKRFRSIHADIQLRFADLDFQLVSELQKLAPHGIGNPSPIFVTHNVQVDAVQPLSSSHLKLKLSDGNTQLVAVAWGFEGNQYLKKGTMVAIAYTPEINHYQGVSSIQLNLKEVWEASPQIFSHSSLEPLAPQLEQKHQIDSPL
jgi:single-stranded-DNA-specific exonuclease